MFPPLSISENPTYLPAIFSLCVMGIMENDETLTLAALQELAKIPADDACKFFCCTIYFYFFDIRYRYAG